MKLYIKSSVMNVSDMDLDSQLELAGDMNTSIDYLMYLATHYDNWEARERALYTLRYIANSAHPERLFDGDYELKWRTAKLCSATEILAVLSDDPLYQIRASVASNSDTPPDLLNKLSYDSDPFVRGQVGGNKNTPDYILAHLANDENFTVRRSVAMNSHTPQTILLKLSNDEDRWVRDTALSNSSFKGGSV